MSIGKRIKSKRKANNLSVIDLANAVGVNRATIYRWERDESTPPKSAIEALSHILHTNSDWLLGTSNMDGINSNWSDYLIDKLYDDYNSLKDYFLKRGFSVVDSSDLVYITAHGTTFPGIEMEHLVENYRRYGANAGLELLTAPYTSRSAVRIPVLGDVAAGIPIEAVEDIIDYEEIPAELAEQGQFFGLRIKGDSMEPRICEGDVVIVKKQEDADTGDIVIACVNGDSATCKRLIKYPDQIVLMSLNNKYDPIIFTMEDVKSTPLTIIGKVVELRGKL